MKQQCVKTKYYGQFDAMYDVLRIKKKYTFTKTLRPYKCPFCKCWHLTSQEKKSKKSKKSNK